MPKPMLASTSSLDELATLENNPRYAVGKKYDGFRELMHISPTGRVKLLSRSGANHSANVPHLTGKTLPDLEDTILDGEGIAPSEDLGDTKSIFGSSPATAIANQDELGKAKYIAFDILRYKGRDLLGLPLKDRLPYLEKAVDALHRYGITQVQQEKLVHHNKRNYYDSVVAKGGEGVIIKDLDASYHSGRRTSAWGKVKKVDTWDAVITGFTDGKGKYTGQIGAIEYGFRRGGRVVPAGKTSGMTDEVRKDISLNPNKYLGKMIEVAGQEISREGAIRHPRVLRIRMEKTMRETSEVPEHPSKWSKRKLDRFLTLWWDEDPTSYLAYHSHANSIGVKMIELLSFNHPGKVQLWLKEI